MGGWTIGSVLAFWSLSAWAVFLTMKAWRDVRRQNTECVRADLQMSGASMAAACVLGTLVIVGVTHRAHTVSERVGVAVEAVHIDRPGHEVISVAWPDGTQMRITDNGVRTGISGRGERFGRNQDGSGSGEGSGGSTDRIAQRLQSVFGQSGVGAEWDCGDL